MQYVKVEQEKIDIASSLKQIIYPHEQIHARYFTNIREVIQRIGVKAVKKEPFELSSIRQLPAVLKKALKVTEEGKPESDFQCM